MRPSLAVSLAVTPLYAQDPSFRGSIGFSGGSYEFDSDLAGFDERADAGLFLAEFEATAANGYAEDSATRVTHHPRATACFVTPRTR